MAKDISGSELVDALIDKLGSGFDAWQSGDIGSITVGPINHPNDCVKWGRSGYLTCHEGGEEFQIEHQLVWSLTNVDDVIEAVEENLGHLT